MKTYLGPDISTHNGNVDMKRVRDAGYKRVGIRAGFGKNNTDQKYNKNALACVNLGVPVILYWFSYAYTIEMARKEAEYAVEHAKKYWDKCPIAFDLEYDSVRYARTKSVNIDKDLATKMAVAFMNRVKELGYIPVIYSNKDYLKNYFNLSYITNAIGPTYLWYARYASAITTEERIFTEDPIKSTELASNAVVTEKIADNNVTNAKLADNSIISRHVTNGTILDRHVGELAAIQQSKIAGLVRI